jgi:hypothetical protein
MRRGWKKNKNELGSLVGLTSKIGFDVVYVFLPYSVFIITKMCKWTRIDSDGVVKIL